MRLPIRLKNSEHFHTSPYPNIEDSTFHRRASVPLSLQNGKRVAFFPFVHLYPFNIYKNIFRFIPAICKDCTVSRIQPGFLPTYEPWLIPTRIPKGFADSKQSLRPLSFLSRTGNVLHSFRQSAFACLPFNKVEEVQHIIVIPSDSHSGINYPPTASKDRAVHSMEIKDFLILWTYSQ